MMIFLLFCLMTGSSFAGCGGNIGPFCKFLCLSYPPPMYASFGCNESVTDQDICKFQFLPDCGPNGYEQLPYAAQVKSGCLSVSCDIIKKNIISLYFFGYDNTIGSKDFASLTGLSRLENLHVCNILL
jgi:hypothetical protein